MAWRTILVTKPAHLSLKNKLLQIKQEAGLAEIAIEDISVLVLDNHSISLTANLLSTFADNNIAVITVDKTHLPNGVFYSFYPHSRALQVMQGQLAMTKPQQKRLWQSIAQQKLLNQASLLAGLGDFSTAKTIQNMAQQIKSGDPDNFEAQAAKIYFNSLFGKGFNRRDESLVNICLNYGYSLVRSALARSLAAYGFLPAFGLHHHNQQNNFNLADDLIEPYRAHVDAWVINLLAKIPEEQTELTTNLKAELVQFLSQDLPRIEQNKLQGKSTVLALIEGTVISLSQRLKDNGVFLLMPGEITGESDE